MSAAPVPAMASVPLSAGSFEHALRSLGLSPGDTVFVHACLDTLDPGADATARGVLARALLDALAAVVGPGGTILVPTYTFSFCRGEPFDVDRTPTAGGPWSRSVEFLELVRGRPGAIRSRDPIHSVAGIGPRAAELLSGASASCFGPGSVFERICRANARICVIGAPLDEATIRHHTEEMAGVPFRYRKLFTGEIRDRDGARREGWVYCVRLRAENGYPDASGLERVARERGVCRAAPVGRGEILMVESVPFHELVAAELVRNPWATARGPAGAAEALDDAATGVPRLQVSLAPGASMHDMVRALWRLPRDIVSPGYDAALRALATQAEMTIHEYPTGLECWSWIVPEKWVCHEAWLETLDGRRLFSYADHPLHVVSYSLPFDGVVTRDELLRHLHVHPRLPEAVPFVFKYYERDWGLCCSAELRDSLQEERYRVHIRTTSGAGTLKVGEIVVPGATDATIMLCAHLCHPAMVNDDLTGVVVGMDVMRRLAARGGLRYTYRFTIVPETIGSVAFLSRSPDLIPRLTGGLFLEMLGRDLPHALQLSFQGGTEVDRCFAAALAARDLGGWTGAYRSIIGNDERQYNAPGVRVPMLSLSRVLRPDDALHPYREYHSSLDTPERVPPGALESSSELVLAMIDVLEANVVPRNRFSGEPFCSRFGVHIDASENPEGHFALFDLLDRIDGTRSILDLADECGISFAAARGAVDELLRRGVVDA